ncbi:hypothetical protein QOZ80_2BG0171640 [Eleusine coracana subsp. coracana]|nr:hypothetical protein QOZ80_2BG0171640 [Eleusine coracana subsp. coracana]
MEDLPEEIQQLVLSLQSLKEAARTSIVSRKWREVWTRYPNLSFDGTTDGSTDEDSVKIKGTKFIETVNSVIRQHTGTMLNKFSIRCYLQNNCSDHLHSISTVRELHACGYMQEDNAIWPSQVYRMKRPTCMLVNLRKLTCELTICTNGPNSHAGILQLAHCLDSAPRLETLELHMSYLVIGGRCWFSESKDFPMSRLDHLKSVYMSGFRCYRPQIDLLRGILQNGAVLEHVTIEPMVKIPGHGAMNIDIPEARICEWARHASERFGKDIAVVKAPRRRWWL